MVKEIVIKTLSTLATFFTVYMLIHGIEINNYSSVLILSIVLAAIQASSKYLLTFLTIPTNVTVVFVANLLFQAIFIYFFKLFAPGFYIHDGYIGPFLNESINIPIIQMKSHIIIVIISAFMSLIDILVNWALNKNR